MVCVAQGLCSIPLPGTPWLDAIETLTLGQPGWLSSLAPPSAQGLILETRDRVPRQAPGAWSLLLPLPVSLPLFLSLSVTIINK